MAAPKKIPPAAKADLLRLYGEGKTGEDIAAWLKKHHGVTVTPEAVRKRIREWNQELGDVASTIAKERLAKEIPAGLDAVEQIAQNLEAARKRILAIDVGDDPKLEIERTYCEQDNLAKQLKVRERQLEMAGVKGGAAETLAEFLGKALSE